MQILSSGKWVSIEYDNFKVDSEALGYALHVSNYWFGEMNDIVYGQNGAKFSTSDRDNDNQNGGACSSAPNNGGFWYYNCYMFCLTCVRGSTYAYKKADFTIVEVASSKMMLRQL